MHLIQISAIQSDTTACPDCDGTGSDPGGLDPFYKTECPSCMGFGTLPVEEADEERNWLGEAFQIVLEEECKPVEREHLVAVVKHCRELMSAVMSLPEVA